MSIAAATTTTTTAQTIVDLRGICRDETAAIDFCIHALQTRGWVLVRLHKDLRLASNAAGEVLEQFFQAYGPEQANRNDLPRAFRFPGHPLLGYDSNDPNRQAVRILTGSELHCQTLPKSLNKPLKELARLVDSKLERISNLLCPRLFGLSANDMGKSCDLPFFRKDETNYTLMEAAYYRNNESSREVVCSSHYDPGLFSLNVFVSEPGLQFQDEHSQWHDMDPSLGVLWTGSAAQEIQQNTEITFPPGFPKTVTPGIHRVVRSTTLNQPRLSVWSEICTKSQIFFRDNVLPNGATLKGQKIYVPNIFSENGEPYIVPIKNGSLLETMQLVQALKGLPTSKSIRWPVRNEDGEVIDIR